MDSGPGPTIAEGSWCRPGAVLRMQLVTRGWRSQATTPGVVGQHRRTARFRVSRCQARCVRRCAGLRQRHVQSHASPPQQRNCIRRACRPPVQRKTARGEVGGLVPALSRALTLIPPRARAAETAAAGRSGYDLSSLDDAAFGGSGAAASAASKVPEALRDRVVHKVRPIARQRSVARASACMRLTFSPRPRAGLLRCGAFATTPSWS